MSFFYVLENGRLFENLWWHRLAKQIITIHIMLNFSRNKSNQSTILGPLKKYNVKKTFPQKSCKNWDWWMIPQLFLFFEKVKTNCIIFHNVGAEIFDFVDSKVLD